MLTICWAAKGGSGTTIYTTARALLRPEPTLLIDLAGDVPLALGAAELERPGVFDWLRSDAPPHRLPAIAQSVAPDLDLIAMGSRGPVPAERWGELADAMQRDPRPVYIDAGTGRPPPELLNAATDRLLVTRACFLSIRRALDQSIVPSGIVHVAEPGRPLRAGDIATALGAPVVDTVLCDPAIARAADSGLLVGRLPGAWRRHLAAA